MSSYYIALNSLSHTHTPTSTLTHAPHTPIPTPTPTHLPMHTHTHTHAYNYTCTHTTQSLEAPLPVIRLGKPAGSKVVKTHSSEKENYMPQMWGKQN